MQIKPGQKLSHQMRVILREFTSNYDWVRVGEEVGISHESIRLILKEINPLRVTEKTHKAFEPLFKQAMINKNAMKQEKFSAIEDCKFEIKQHKSEISRINKCGLMIDEAINQIMGKI